MKIGKGPQNPFQLPPPQFGQQPPVQRAAAPQANPFQQKFAGGHAGGHPPGDHLAAFKSQIAPGGGLNVNLNNPRHGDKVGGRLSVSG